HGGGCHSPVAPCSICSRVTVVLALYAGSGWSRAYSRALTDHLEPAECGALPPCRELGRSWLPRPPGARRTPGRRNPMPRVVDTRIPGCEPLLSPAALLLELRLGDAESALVEKTRADVRAVLDGTDDRILVITGPCSVHDPKAALDYARRLVEL